ncbi:integrase core domain-containing protein [Streptomyces kebangsaanensis]|uniref:integrase core domain-containing protein n=1 Tax=Streptomyces kebangsaanensis TaxID=864058 RepID=UPI003899E427
MSVGRRGRCWDNVLAESFFGTLKREVFGDRPWPGRAAAHTAIFEWSESRDDLRRLHSSLGHRSPAECETVLAARPPHRWCPSKRNKLTCGRGWLPGRVTSPFLYDKRFAPAAQGLDRGLEPLAEVVSPAVRSAPRT